jgi:uncharacterized protein YcbK (DUF882 family)
MNPIFRTLIFIFLLSVLIFFLYCNNLSLANKETVSYYHKLRKALKEEGYKPRLLVVSTKRFSFHNNLLVKFSGAATKSRHLQGDAIDFVVFDINNDGNWNSKDVDIVRSILVNDIMKDKGGVGTYKNDRSLIYRQMVHIDCRKGKTRWSQ